LLQGRRCRGATGGKKLNQCPLKAARLQGAGTGFLGKVPKRLGRHKFSSPSFIRRSRDISAYSSAKAATVGLTRTLSRDMGDAGIRVNTVLPGWIITERQAVFFKLVGCATAMPSGRTGVDQAA